MRLGYSLIRSTVVAGCSERTSSKAAASEEANAYSPPYVESLSAARTPLVDFVNGLLVEISGLLAYSLYPGGN